MRTLLYALGTFWILIFTSGCSSPSGPECLKTTGDLQTIEMDLPAFSKLFVGEGVRLKVRQGTAFSIRITGGKNLIDNMGAEVKGETLEVYNDNSCNLFRSYTPAEMLLTVPDLKEIRCATQYELSSDGILNFPEILVYCENFLVPEVLTNADINLNLNSNNIRMVLNGLSPVTLQGTAETFSLEIAAGNARVDASTLIAGKVEVYHRGSNEMHVNPQLELSGDLLSTGNLYAHNRPAVVQVNERYKGRLIFVD